MSDYQRIVSYLYEYNHGIKGANVGFARIERRKNQIKLYFHVKTNEQALPYKIYFYRFHQGVMEGTYLDSFQKSDAIIEMKRSYPASINLNEIDGFLIYHSDQLFFGSEWNEKNIAIKNFLPLNSSKEETSEDKIPKEEPAKKEPIKEDPPKEATSKLVEYIEALQLEKKAKETPPKETSTDFDWKEYPSLPLSSPVIFDPCVKITLDDLSHIPKIPKKLQGNGFLLLNYGNYGYLLLGQNISNGKMYLGVPGTFDNEKNFIAKFFGFEHFRTMPEKNQKTGNFGYWLLSI